MSLIRKKVQEFENINGKHSMPHLAAKMAALNNKKPEDSEVTTATNTPQSGTPASSRRASPTPKESAEDKKPEKKEDEEAKSEAKPEAKSEVKEETKEEEEAKSEAKPEAKEKESKDEKEDEKMEVDNKGKFVYIFLFLFTTVLLCL